MVFDVEVATGDRMRFRDSGFIRPYIICGLLGESVCGIIRRRVIPFHGR